ncbi:MAG: DUF192 domain-containing protein [Bacteroidales bacterium]|nr:DUF192 domain-containing protein [Bacteroidales bacterium]
MKIKALTYILLLSSTFALIGCDKTPKPKGNNGNKPTKELKVKKYDFDNPPEFRKDGELQFINDSDSIIFNIDIELATTEEEHARGLMFRKQMDENKGMLFMFSYEDWRSFWMRNTLIPLDIIYVNAKREVVSICKNAKTLDETSLPSEAPAMYVIEINAGHCDKYGIDKGTKVNF